MSRVVSEIALCRIWPATTLLVAACSLLACGTDSSSGTRLVNTPTQTNTRTPTRTPTATNTPTATLPDLVAVSAQDAGCIGPRYCGPYRLDICIQNRGGVDVTEPFNVTLAGENALTVPGLATDELACFAVAASYPRPNAVIEVDPQGVIPDSDRSNNKINYPFLDGLRCDLLCLDPTPTPARLP